MSARSRPAIASHRRELAGYETRILEVSGEGPALVLLHGFSDSADTWRPLLALLGDRGRRALALDLPGFGTAAPLEPGPILPQFDRVVRAALEELGGADPPIVVGNSLGGLVALRQAAGTEPRLSGAVGLAPAGLHVPRWVILVERDPVVRLVLASPLPIPERLIAAALGEAYRRLAFCRPRAVDRQVVARYASHVGTRAAFTRAIATLQRLLPELRRPPQLDAITCPTVLIWGRRDRLISRAGFEPVLRAAPAGELVVLDCGHCPQIEAPEQLLEVLLESRLLGFDGPPETRAA